MSSGNKYFICRRIDEPKRYIGLTIDEIVPIITISGICFFFGSLATGFVLAGVVWCVIRHFKKGQGTGWLLSYCTGTCPCIICKEFYLLRRRHLQRGIGSVKIMDYKAAQTKLQSLSGRVHYMLLISIGLLVSNIFLVWLVGWSFAHQKRTIVPAEINQAFTVSDSKVDASYLRQMALFFIAERLNLTPSNINQSHATILQYTDSKFYHEFVSVLAKEKQSVITQNISSVFYPEEIIALPSELSVRVNGSLMHWVGNVALSSTKKNYKLKFSYKSGNLKVLSFAEVNLETEKQN